MDEGGLDDNIDWEEEREMERVACEGDDFTPPKIMVGDCDIWVALHILQLSTTTTIIRYVKSIGAIW